jgi:hypothetical protein
VTGPPAPPTAKQARRLGGPGRRVLRSEIHAAATGSPGRRRPGCPGAEAGSAALEIVVLAPVLILLICFMIAAGRVAIAHGSIDAAARDAARQASLARSPEQALAALSTARTELAAEGLSCIPSINHADLDRAFAVPLGQPSNVTITVRCSVSLSGLLLKGLPGHVPVQASFTSPLDPYRGRSDALGPAAVFAGAA